MHPLHLHAKQPTPPVDKFNFRDGARVGKRTRRRAECVGAVKSEWLRINKNNRGGSSTGANVDKAKPYKDVTALAEIKLRFISNCGSFNKLDVVTFTLHSPHLLLWK